MTDPRSVSIEELLQEESFARRLAGFLLSDEQDADDVVQETWLAALKQAPRTTGSVRGWISAVVRNRVAKKRRGEERRSRREERAARPEALPAVDEVAERMRMQRVLLGAVLELPEPYRQVVILRYYHGLSPGQIAREIEAPVSTVRTRLRRAADRLRVGLEAELGPRGLDWRLGIAALVVPPREAVASHALSAGVAIMSTKAKVGSAVVVLAALGLLGVVVLESLELVGEAPEERKAQAPSSVAGDAASSERAQATPLEALPPEEKVATTEESQDRKPASIEEEAPTPPAGERVVYGTISDTDGHPLEDIRVSFVTERGISGIRSKSDSDGRYVLEIKADEVPRLVDAHVVTILTSYRDARIPLKCHEPRCRVDITLEPGLELRGRLVDEVGMPLPGRQVHGVKPAGFHMAHSVFDQSTDEDGQFAIAGLEGTEGELDLSILSGVRTLIPRVPIGSGDEVEIRIGGYREQGTGRLNGHIQFLSSPPAVLEGEATANLHPEVTVNGQLRKPSYHAPIRGLSWSAPLQPDGTFDFGELRPGRYSVWAKIEGYQTEMPHREVIVYPGDVPTTTVVVVMEPAREDGR